MVGAHTDSLSARTEYATQAERVDLAGLTETQPAAFRGIRAIVAEVRQ